MKKRVCDRCGCEMNKDKDQFGIFEYPRVLVSSAYIEHVGDDWTDVDLCKRCLKDFLYWIKKGA